MEFSSRRRNYMLVKHRRDKLLEFIRDLLEHSFVLDCMVATLPNSWRHIEELIEELHSAQMKDDGSADRTRLKKMIPSIGHFHTPLKLVDAFQEHDAKYCMSKRRFVRPSFNDVRHILNLAQINALVGSLKLITFDGDCTLYSDGNNFQDPELAWAICRLLSNGVSVALVTAAGYGLVASKYEFRIQKLLESFTTHGLSSEAKQRFYVLGGECNYLLQCGADSHLTPIDEKTWTGQVCHGWPAEQVQTLLDVSQNEFETAIEELRLKCRIIRKERAVGFIPGGKSVKSGMPVGSGSKNIRRELLDEVVLRCHAAITAANVSIPFCAFNGGNDVWVDVGNKKVGVNLLQKYLDIAPESSLHVGDQFSNTGNDFAARSCATTAWIISPIETKYLIQQVLVKHEWCTVAEIKAGASFEGGKGGFV